MPRSTTRVMFLRCLPLYKERHFSPLFLNVHLFITLYTNKSSILDFSTKERTKMASVRSWRWVLFFFIFLVTTCSVTTKAMADANIHHGEDETANHSESSWTEWAKEKISGGLGFKDDNNPTVVNGKHDAANIRQTISDAGDFTKEKAGEAREAAKDGAFSAKQTASEKEHEVKSKAHEVSEEAKEKAAGASKKAGDLKDEALEKAEEVKEKGRRKAEEAKQKAYETEGKAEEGRRKGEAAKGKAEEMGKLAAEKAKEGYEAVKETAKEGYEAAKEKVTAGIESAKQKQKDVKKNIIDSEEL